MFNKPKPLHYLFVALIAILTFQCTEESQEKSKEETHTSQLADSSKASKLEKLIDYYNVPPLDSVPALTPVFDNAVDAMKFIADFENAQFQAHRIVRKENTFFANSVQSNPIGVGYGTFTFNKFPKSYTEYTVTVHYTYCVEDGRFLSVEGITGAASGMHVGSFEVTGGLASIYADSIGWQVSVQPIVVFRYKGRVYGYSGASKMLKGAVRKKITPSDSDTDKCDQQARDYYFYDME